MEPSRAKQVTGRVNTEAAHSRQRDGHLSWVARLRLWPHTVAAQDDPVLQTLGAAMASLNYEIRVVGAVSPEVLLDYDRLNVDQEAGIVLLGPLPDQAALCRLLARLEFYGIQIHEVRRISGTEHAALPHPPAA